MYIYLSTYLQVYVPQLWTLCVQEPQVILSLGALS